MTKKFRPMNDLDLYFECHQNATFILENIKEMSKKQHETFIKVIAELEKRIKATSAIEQRKGNHWGRVVGFEPVKARGVIKG